MHEPTILDYSSIRHDPANEGSTFQAMASLTLAAAPFLGWALHSEMLILVPFLLSWLGLLLGIGGIIKARKQPVAVVAGSIGILINGLMALCVVLFFLHGGMC